MRLTKIVATLGPASWDRICELAQAGVNVFRINASHAKKEQIPELTRAVRECSKKIDRHLTTLLDLPGPRIRTGKFSEPLMLRPMDEVEFVLGKGVGGKSHIYIDFPPLFEQIKKGDPILMADGSIEVVVTSVGKNSFRGRVVRGGILRCHKGVNVPTLRMKEAAFTPEDQAAAQVGATSGITVYALSFVGSAATVEKARNFLRQQGIEPFLISKIERKAALQNLDEIIDTSDGIMVARGDLAVEVGLEQVGLLQKRIISVTRNKGKPVITATQMLESMVEASRPTRAEVSDVTNAILDGTDAVMLSEETAIGKFPVQTVSFMDKICQAVEKSEFFSNLKRDNCKDRSPEGVLADMIQAAVEDRLADAIILPNCGHKLMSHVSSKRLGVPVFIDISNDFLKEIANLYFGIILKIKPQSALKTLMATVSQNEYSLKILP